MRTRGCVYARGCVSLDAYVNVYVRAPAQSYDNVSTLKVSVCV